MKQRDVAVVAVRALARVLAILFPPHIRAARHPSFADVAEHRWHRERSTGSSIRATVRTAGVLLSDFPAAIAFWRAAMFHRFLGLSGDLRGFSLDLKLGGRMLVKYPGLTIIGGVWRWRSRSASGRSSSRCCRSSCTRPCRCPRATASCRSATGTSRRIVPSHARCTTSTSGAARCGP